MRGWTLVMLLALGAPQVEAQRVEPPRLAKLQLEYGDDALRREFPKPSIVAGQVFFGAVGMAGGGLAGGYLAAAMVRGGEPAESFLDLAAVLTGVLVGGMFGSSYAVFAFSKRVGHPAPYWGALLGSAAGVVGGEYFVITMPIGAVVGHNLAHRREP